MKCMAIMRNVRFGLHPERGDVGLSFDAMVHEQVGAPIFLAPLTGAELIDGYDATDVNHLEGRPVWVQILDGGVCLVDGPCLV